MTWRDLTRVADFASYLEVSLSTFQTARRQRSSIYVEKQVLITKRKKLKLRDLCYPPHGCELRTVQMQLKNKCLATLPISDAVRGYREGQHNINCAQIVAGLPHVGKIDLKDFHPSVTPELTAEALIRLSVSRPLCRMITQLVTYKNGLPQGAITSNHMANLVVDMVLRDGVLQFCARRCVTMVNFGDDTAFGGRDRASVDECVEFAKQRFAKFGLLANSKSSSAEHVGAARSFVGTATGRAHVDLPRQIYREYRKELRAAFTKEGMASVFPLVTETEMRSFRGKISYTARLNPYKARQLKEIFHRLARRRRDKLALRSSLTRCRLPSPSKS